MPLNIVCYKVHMISSATKILVLIILIQVLTKALVNLNGFVQNIHSERIGLIILKSTAETLFPDISINLLKLPSSQAIVSEKSFVASH